MHNYSPLRYPGGKTRLLPLIEELLESSGLVGGHYAEPFAGGAGLALGLLIREKVERISINDIDDGIYSFWRSVFQETDKFVDLIESTPVTVEEWDRQKAIYRQQETSSLARGFATFFLNRTNRSGVIKSGGMLGGRSQKGDYPIDCRFNKDDLIRRILRISDLKSRISISNEDSIQFIRRLDKRNDEKTLVYLDPPYFRQGSKLYTNFYEARDHVELSQEVRRLKTSWLVTYDDAPEIRALYAWAKPKLLDISYSLNRKRIEKEVVAVSPNLVIPFSQRVNPLVA